MNIRGGASAGRVQVVTTALKILPLALVGIAGCSFSTGSHFAISANRARRAFARGVTTTATLTLWAFLGLECATIPAAASATPSAHSACHWSAPGRGLIYIVSTVGVMGCCRAATLGQTTAPFAEAARALAGDRAAADSQSRSAAAISCFGALNGWILIVGPASDGGRARTDCSPRMFRRVSARGTPRSVCIVGSVLATALIAMNYTRDLVALFTFIILLATLSTLVPYVFCSLAGFLAHSSARSGQAPGAPGTPDPLAPLARKSFPLWPSRTSCGRSAERARKSSTGDFCC